MDYNPPGSLSMEFSRQEYCSGLPFPPPGDLPNPGIETVSLVSPVLQVDCLSLSHQGSLFFFWDSLYDCIGMLMSEAMLIFLHSFSVFIGKILYLFIFTFTNFFICYLRNAVKLFKCIVFRVLHFSCPNFTFLLLSVSLLRFSIFWIIFMVFSFNFLNTVSFFGMYLK